ncbi:ankyrin repeat and MYND domain-containing protein 1-like [Onthophagus taurus]|uniref:ankyrin repeat and MYND domain-containing protein 1-like n=1 Tax=Onthophagus taurus TaxID=166361 RepID=UPI0039BDB90D
MDKLYVIESGYFPASKQTYKGDLNFANQRSGEGEQIWQCKSFERYQGDFFQDSLHGYGTYTWLQENKNDFLVEGTFHGSFIHGYSSIAYSNESYFEGLIRRNKRFGPGVLSYLNGNQDVGLWNGDRLSRICYTIFPEYLPILAYSGEGKKKLLKFKTLITLCEEDFESKDVAIEILKKLGAPKDVLRLSNQLYNPFVRNIKSLLFDKKLYDAQIYDGSLNSGQTEEKLSQVFDYLLENGGDLEKIPEGSRLSFMESKIIDENPDLIQNVNFDLIKNLLDAFFEEFNLLLAHPSGERNLILIKQNILRKLPEKYKNDSIPPLSSRVLAWNNSQESIEMLKYTYRNLNLEKNVSFNVRSLLIGDRLKFGPPGDYEMCCIRFLQEASNGNDQLAARLLTEKNVNPDVSDSKGNVAAIFASAKDKWGVLKMLCNFGADLDKVNDDGLSALSMCILRYVAYKKDIVDWERAFLNDTTKENVENDNKWRFKDSSVDLKAMLDENDVLEVPCDDVKGFQGEYELIADQNQRYLFSTEIKLPPVKKIKFDKKVSHKKSKSSKSAKTNQSRKSSQLKINTLKRNKSIIKSETKIQKVDSKQLLKEENLNTILTTIKTLLELGCDPNFCQVPLPSVLIAVYSDCQEIVDVLIEYNADLNVFSPTDGLTPLHLLCCLPFSTSNTEMFETILKSGANPNQKASPSHWLKEKLKLLGKIRPDPSIIDKGKNPSHILSMRYDFEWDLNDYQLKMFQFLLEFKLDLNEVYLGHTPFSIAILRGNVKLIKWFVESNLIDPYGVFGENMGSALTILILKRYNLILPLEVAQEVYDVLIGFNFNPLVNILNKGNVIEFMEEEYKVIGDEKKEMKKKGKKVKGKAKKSKKGKKNPVDELKKYLLLKTKEMLQRNIVAKAFLHLRIFIILIKNETTDIMKTLIQFFSLKTIQKCLQLLIQRGIIEYNKLNIMVIYKFLNLLNDFLKKKDKHISTGDIFYGLYWKIIENQKNSNLIEPEIDTNEEIYKVCFYCCKKSNKKLIICPMCGLVYFCSQECNKLSNKKSTIHNCNYLYYDKERFKMNESSKFENAYKESNQLQEALNKAYGDIYNNLMGKFGSLRIYNLLKLSKCDDLSRIDYLIKSCGFIRNFVEEKLEIVASDEKELIETLGDALEAQNILKEIRRKKKSTSKLSVRSRSNASLKKRIKKKSQSKLSIRSRSNVSLKKSKKKSQSKLSIRSKSNVSLKKSKKKSQSKLSVRSKSNVSLKKTK